jgi:hypothetical protein
MDGRDVHNVNGHWSDRWDYNLSLYAILHPTAYDILYLGKATVAPILSRWNVDDKHDRVWSRIEGERELFEHGFIVGEFRLPDGQRLTRQLVCDVERLLVHQIKPWLREVITNALDEQALTKTKDVEVYKDKAGRWHIHRAIRNSQSLATRPS